MFPGVQGAECCGWLFWKKLTLTVDFQQAGYVKRASNAQRLMEEFSYEAKTVKRAVVICGENSLLELFSVLPLLLPSGIAFSDFHFISCWVDFLMTIQLFLWNAEHDQMADHVDFLAAHDAGLIKVKFESFWNVDVVAWVRWFWMSILSALSGQKSILSDFILPA